VIWDLTRAYPDELRGEQCTSADAAGLPIAALLFTADEIAAGEIPHAIRFILPNSRMRAGVYVHPATHAGAPSGNQNLPPYGVRFRLRADYPVDSLDVNARVIARALQKYGMILSDGGNIALTAASDRYSTHTWDSLGIDSYALADLEVGDFEVLAFDAPIPITYDCERTD
jgi:serine/threonine-protein kinase